MSLVELPGLFLDVLKVFYNIFPASEDVEFVVVGEVLIDPLDIDLSGLIDKSLKLVDFGL